jgi:hypothetical protein
MPSLREQSKIKKILHYGSLSVILIVEEDYCMWSVRSRDVYRQVEILN